MPSSTFTPSTGCTDTQANRRLSCPWVALLVLAGLGFTPIQALEYAYAPADPQPTGWPLTEAERQFMLKAEYERRPGAADSKYLPNLWPSVPFGQFWNGSGYIDMHDNLVKMAKANAGPCDVLLVGDSITIQFEKDLSGNENWKQQFPEYKAINIGVGGDRTHSVLWRLDHGGADGLQPRSIVLMIGNNNMFFANETGIEAIAKGIKTCVDRLREQFPKTPIVVVKILPFGAPGDPFYENTIKTNAALNPLNLTSDPLVRVLDFNKELLNADGTLNAELYQGDKIHLNKAGYALYAKHLRPVLAEFLTMKK